MKLPRFTSRLIALILALASPGAARAKAEPPPNILYIVSDDHGYNDLGSFGSAHAATLSPRLDQLAAEGVRLTDFYVTSPVCTPSRGGLLTARYNQRYDFEKPDLSIAAVMKTGLSQKEAILPQYLKRQGYATACFGKWHIGFAPGSRPTERGFDEFLGVAGGLNDYFNHYNVGNLDMFLGNNPREPKPGGEYTTDLFADAAIDFIGRKKDAPFFIYLPFTAPHWAPSTNPPQVERPAQAPQAVLDLYPGETAARKGCLAAITAMDAAIGRILDRLDELGLAGNTIVIFHGDHGGETNSTYGGGNNTPLRGKKADLWEGGIRTPAIVRWPGIVPAGTTCGVPLISMDLSALALAAAGATTTGLANGPIDGKNPTEVLKGNAASLRDFLCWRYAGDAAIRKGKYKLVGSSVSNGIGGTLRLYDLDSDIGESTDLSSAMPAKVSELQSDFNNVWKPAIANDTALP